MNGKSAKIKFVFINGTERTFSDVVNLRIDWEINSMELLIRNHDYYTRVFADKVLYFEEIIDEDEGDKE